MSRWERGAAAIERLIDGGELQTISGDAANGAPWLVKSRRTLRTAAAEADADPDSAFTLAYDAARFACLALLARQGLRATTAGGHYAVDMAVREQFGGKFSEFAGLRRQRNDIEYPEIVGPPLAAEDARSAITLATELADAAVQLLPHLGLFSDDRGRV
jgi:hypothetical protein